MDITQAQDLAFHVLAAIIITLVVVATLGSWYWLQDKLGFFWSLGLLLLCALTLMGLLSLL